MEQEEVRGNTMGKDDWFWFCIWRTVAVAVVCLAAIVAACDGNNARLVADAVAKGADPILASCGIRGESNQGNCFTYGAKTDGR